MSLARCSSNRLEAAKVARRSYSTDSSISSLDRSRRASAPNEDDLHRVKRRSSTRANPDEECKASDEKEIDATPTFFGEQVPTQLKVLTFLSRQRSKKPFVDRIRCIGGKQFVVS